jgi:hypothetical protein
MRQDADRERETRGLPGRQTYYIGRKTYYTGHKTYYICEAISMYVPEEGMKETLRANPPTHATASTNGSSASPWASAFEEARGVTGGERQ